MAINASKVVVAGLAAGLVANVVGFAAFGLLLWRLREARRANVNLAEA